MSAGTDLEMLLRVVGSLVAVVALALVAARLARRAGMSGEGVGMRVVDRIGLTRDGALTVVEVSGRVLVLGVTTTSVTLVTELDPSAVTTPPASGSAARGSASEGSASHGSASHASAAGGAALDGDSVVTEPGAAVAARLAGTGSVLDPRTWAQGLDALRELTVRR